MNFVDALTIDGTRKRQDGALIVDARAARTGVQIYAGYEVGRPDLSSVRVMRSADEVFSRDSLASFAHRPVTNNHPAEPVTADNWKSVAVGQTADEVRKDDIYVRVPLMVSDGAAISDIEGGKRELSVGYTCDLEWVDGQTHDAEQKNIRVNHIAIVDAGRAGKNCRIGDQKWIAPVKIEDSPMPKMIIVDGLPIDISNADVAESVIRRLETSVADARTAHETAIKAKDERIGELTAEVKKLTDAAPKPADVAKMVRDRASLISTAKAIVPNVEIGDEMTDAEIRKTVVAKKLGDDAVKDASESEISGMFKVVSRDVKADDPFAAAVAASKKTAADANINDNGQAAYEKRLRDAYKGETAA